jgi:stress response protein YsnF
VDLIVHTGMEDINWDEVTKKEARGSDDYDLGEVQEVTSDNVVTQKGILDKKQFEIPKRLVKSFDGNKITFGLSESDAESLYLKDKPDVDDTIAGSETTIPLIQEKLEPAKKEKVVEATIVKEPVKETKEVNVELTHEELVIERNPLNHKRPTKSQSNLELK